MHNYQCLLIQLRDRSPNHPKPEVMQHTDDKEECLAFLVYTGATSLTYWDNVSNVETMASSGRGMNPVAMTSSVLGKKLSEQRIEPAPSCSNVLKVTN